jgi:hypothetical protein
MKGMIGDLYGIKIIENKWLPDNVILVSPKLFEIIGEQNKDILDRIVKDKRLKGVKK